jgi:hypothetical protein
MTSSVIDFNLAARQGEHKPGYVDADSLRQRLNADPAAFVQWLFSGRAILGKHEARIGNKCGEPGESLAIQLSGPDAGMWYDHATAEGGDLIGLYQAYMNYDKGRNFQLALKEIASEYFGDSTVQVSRPAWQPSASQRIEEKKAKLGDKPKAENLELGAPVENYPYHDRAGNILAVVRRYEPGGLDEYGKPKKTFRASPSFPNPRPLYRVPQIIQSTHIVLCEGERKANALASLGIEATTAMGGANTKIEEVDWSPLARKTVTLWPDKDKAGEEYMRRVAPVLTSLGCQVGIVTPPADKPAKWDAYDCVQEGGDAAALIEGAIPITASAQPTGRFRFLDLDDIEDLTPPDWLIDNVITTSGLSVLWGKSGDMKSFVALDMALCVAAGAPWHGIQTKPGLAIYVAAEGAFGLARRAVGWRHTRGKDLPKPNFKIVPHTISMVSSDLDQLIEQIQGLPTKPTFIVIDTLARTFGAGDENKQADMNAYVSASDRLREATGAHVMIVHHTGVHADKRERGSNVLRGAADTMMKVQRNGERLAIVNQAPEGKQKDAEEFKTIYLRATKTAFQAGGTEQSTLILNLDEDQSEPKEAKKAQPEAQPGPLQKEILTLLKKADRPMKFGTIMAAMPGHNNGSIGKALTALVEKHGLLKVDLAEDGGRTWELI